MVTQEGAPSLGGRPGSLDHVLRDARLSDLKAEFEQLAMDARGAPQWVVNADGRPRRCRERGRNPVLKSGHPRCWRSEECRRIAHEAATKAAAMPKAATGKAGSRSDDRPLSPACA